MRAFSSLKKSGRIDVEDRELGIRRHARNTPSNRNSARACPVRLRSFCVSACTDRGAPRASWTPWRVRFPCASPSRHFSWRVSAPSPNQLEQFLQMLHDTSRESLSICRRLWCSSRDRAGRVHPGRATAITAFGIVGVLLGAAAKQNRARAKASCNRATSGARSRVDFSSAIESRYGCDRADAAFFDRRFVHAGCVVVADFLRHHGARSGRCSSFFEDAAQEIQIVLIELAVNVPAVWSGGIGLAVCHARTRNDRNRCRDRPTCRSNRDSGWASRAALVKSARREPLRPASRRSCPQRRRKSRRNFAPSPEMQPRPRTPPKPKVQF